MLQSLLAAALVPALDTDDTRSLSRCCRYTWDLERRRVRDLGIRVGRVVATPILDELELFCYENDIDIVYEYNWRRQVLAVIDRRPMICDELYMTYKGPPPSLYAIFFWEMVERLPHTRMAGGVEPHPGGPMLGVRAAGGRRK